MAILGLFAIGQAARSDEVENYKKLASMPRERRLALSDNLERFDKLDSSEQARIRRLDSELAKKQPEDQARYRAVLRSYHLWVASLPQDKQEKLREAKTSEERFNLAAKFRAEEKQSASNPLPRIMGVRTGDYGMIGPYEVAHLLKVWRKLSPARQAAISRKGERRYILREIRDEGKNQKITGPPALPKVNEDQFSAAFKTQPEFDVLLKPLANRVEQAHKEAEDAYKSAVKRGEDATAKKPPPNPRKFEHFYAEFLYHEENPPHHVLQKDLDRFIAAAPAWFLEVLDPLCPDDARYFVQIVYRLLYPHPDNMPDEAKTKADAAKSDQPTKKPTTKPGMIPEKF